MKKKPEFSRLFKEKKIYNKKQYLIFFLLNNFENKIKKIVTKNQQKKSIKMITLIKLIKLFFK